MAVLNDETRDAWQRIARALSKQRPYAGRKVEVVGGQLHRGRRGTVIRHQLDHYSDAFRYGGDASRHMTRMAGRYGYVVRVLPETSGGIFWVKAHYVICVDEHASCAECGEKHLGECDGIARLAETIHGTTMPGSEGP